MRELPEPDIISEVKHFACPKCLADLGYQSPIHIGYRRDQVLAIQKQAYEDGLRDAAKRCNEIASGWYASVTGNDAAKECGEEILYMLTALQKEQQ